MDVATREMLRQMLRKEKDYFTGLKENQGLITGVAQRLQHGGQVETLLQNNEKLQEYRESVKALAANNVLQERYVRSYVNGLQEIANGADSTIDFSKQLKNAMSTAQEDINRDSVEVHQEPAYLMVCQELGEKTGSNQEENDDDIVFMANDGNGGKSLKCPITGTLMKDPFRNRVCGHVYEHEAIKQHIRAATYKKCPVAGCNNQHINVNQLEPDMATAQLIRREKIRQQHAQEQQRATQDAIEFDDEEPENEMTF